MVILEKLLIVVTETKGSRSPSIPELASVKWQGTSFLRSSGLFFKRCWESNSRPQTDCPRHPSYHGATSPALKSFETQFTIQPKLVWNSLWSPDWPQLVVPLSQPLKCSEYRYAPLHPDRLLSACVWTYCRNELTVLNLHFSLSLLSWTSYIYAPLSSFITVSSWSTTFYSNVNLIILHCCVFSWFMFFLWFHYHLTNKHWFHCHLPSLHIHLCVL